MGALRTTIWCTVCALTISACDSRVSPYLIPTPVPGDPDGFSIAPYQSTGVRLGHGHQVELVNDGAIFDRLEQEFAQSQRSINVVLFIWQPRRLISALSARVKARVTCRILVDAVGSSDFEGALKPALTSAGCDVRLAHPLNHTRGWP